MPIVAKKPGNSGGVKGHYGKHLFQSKLEGVPLEYEFYYGLSGGTQKGGHSGKTLASAGETWSKGQTRTDLILVNAQDDCFLESRMRENCTSGSSRGE